MLALHVTRESILEHSLELLLPGGVPQLELYPVVRLDLHHPRVEVHSHCGVADLRTPALGEIAQEGGLPHG